ncbi:hypothetical protein [Picosynechococcus sp. NKBG042902]|uniref:hypothetical protein n=1 Tax=Picosynechococcus sp. NKBG042902 TaxID=490193 RepID=UPI0006949A67|nr:hypothetical protein [Picosynechococcus sp. NKBG042902]
MASSVLDIFRLKRFDQVVLAALFSLTLAVALLWGFGDRTLTQVQAFSWEGQQIGVTDEQFQLSFNQALDPAIVTENFTIEPPLAGRWSWVGKTFFYSLDERPIYGQDYQFKLAAPTPEAAEKPNIVPFLSRVKSRDRAFAYIGTDGTDRGRLILYNLTRQEKSVLTPADLIVLNLDVYPEGDRLLFSAIPRGSAQAEIGDQQLYTVSTGLNFQGSTDSPPPAGRIQSVLTATDYRNGAFQLADNGERIIIQRTNRENPRDRSLWVIEGQAEPRALGIPADDFLLAPNAEVVAISQQNQLSLVPLNRNGGAIQAKEEFTKLLAFSPDQTQQIALKQANGVYSLHRIDAQGEATEILRTLTPIIDCRFEPRAAELLYCLKLDRNETSGQVVEEPFLSALNLKTGEETALLALPNYRDVGLSIAADGVALLFDQVVTTPPTPTSDLFTATGLAVEGGRLWLLALPELETDTEIQPVPPESLLPGYQPQWIP